jgi:hypothetical protein
LAEGLEPGAVVEFGVVLLDQALVVDFHVVDAVDRVWQGNDSPSPGDGVAVVPDVEDGDGDFRLENTLAVVESGLAVEGDGSELAEQSVRVDRNRVSETYREASHEVDRVGDVNEVDVESSIRDGHVVAGSLCSLGAIVRGVLEQVDEVVYQGGGKSVVNVALSGWGR